MPDDFPTPAYDLTATRIAMLHNRNTEPGRRKAAHATSIVATIGPASEDHIGEMIDAGLKVARINFSHGAEEEHRRRIQRIREEAEKRQAVVGILGDIPGPKLRLGRFPEGSTKLKAGEHYLLREGDGEAVEGEVLLDFQGFTRTVQPGHRVFLGDAAIELEVEKVHSDSVSAIAVRGGRISDRKGVHLPDTPLKFAVPTPEDRGFIELANELELDMLGISFVSRSEEVERIRGLAPNLLLVAKIERLAALENIDSILNSADGLMVARGDLGVEVDLEQLPLMQKSLIQKARQAGKFTITATEMLESMVHAARPTRAEVTDVANAVLDGTDAVMLSAETAVGKYPVRTIETMGRIAAAIEGSQRYHDMARMPFRSAEPTFSNAVAMSAVRSAEALGLSKIVCFTESGNTVRQLSGYRPSTQIVALSPHERTLRRMTVLANVLPLQFPRGHNLEDMLERSQKLLIERGVARHGDEVAFVAGVPSGVSHSTNVLKLHRIGTPVEIS